MPNTKDPTRVVDKWQRRASVAGQDYQDGINTTPKSWEQNATAGDANYRAGVTAAAAAGRFAAGVREAGNERWKQGALKKGPSRFSEGVMVAAPDYGAKIQKVLTTIQSVTLPPRGPRGSAQNFQRVQPIGAALRRAFGKEGASR